MQRILAEIDSLTGQLADVRNAVSTVRADLLGEILRVNSALTEARADITTLCNSHRSDVSALWAKLHEHNATLSRLEERFQSVWVLAGKIKETLIDVDDRVRKLESQMPEQRLVKLNGVISNVDGSEGEGLYLTVSNGQVMQVDAEGNVSLADELHEDGRLRGDVIFMYDGLAFTYSVSGKFDRFANLRELMELETRIDDLAQSHSCGCEAIADAEIDAVTADDVAADGPAEAIAITYEEIKALVAMPATDCGHDDSDTDGEAITISEIDGLVSEQTHN